MQQEASRTSQKMQTKKHNKAESHASKKRNTVQRIVVAVKVERHDDKKQKSEGPPSDSWSWRKYGQKPIKGSPYPRGYYRCSTSKGCTAKKQVERCKTDASMLIITYTSTHNHPGPHLPITNTTNEDQQYPKTPNQEEEPKQEQIKTVVKCTDEAHLHYSQSPFNGSQDMIITSQEENAFKEKLDITYDSPSVVFDEDPLSNCPQAINFPTCKSDHENDFFDELDELPTTSSFTQLLRSNFVEGRILV